MCSFSFQATADVGPRNLPEDSVELVLIHTGYSFGVQAPVVLGSGEGQETGPRHTAP